MLQIRNHLLVGDDVTVQLSPNHGGTLQARFLVMHYTAGSSLESSVTSLCNPAAKASAHVVLGRDGRIVQLVPFNQVAWHAGVSAWMGLNGLNTASIGIEMDNAGPLDEVNGRYYAWFRKEYPATQVQKAAHKSGGPVRAWHAYTGAQIERALEVATLLASTYGLADVLGHDDIAPGRKQDPGPAFPLEALRSRVLGRQHDALQTLVVTASQLNIRSAPDANAPLVPGGPLPQSTKLLLLEPGARWCKVEVIGPQDLEGWVSTAFVRPDGT